MPELWEPEHPDGNSDAWKEEGSDTRMDFDVLVKIRALAEMVEAERERKIERRGE